MKSVEVNHRIHTNFINRLLHGSIVPQDGTNLEFHTKKKSNMFKDDDSLLKNEVMIYLFICYIDVNRFNT